MNPAALASCLLFAGPALAGGDVTVLVEEGQALPGGLNVLGYFEGAAVNDSGSWAAGFMADNGQRMVLVDGALHVQSGMPYGSGTFVGTAHQHMELDAAGRLVFLAQLTGGPKIGLFVDGTPIAESGDLVGVPELDPSATYDWCFTARIDDVSRILALWRVNDPTVPLGQTIALIEHTYDASGNPVGVDLHYQIGDTIPGQTETISSFATVRSVVDVASNGDILFMAGLAPSGDAAVFLNTTELARTGSPSPWGGAWQVSYGSALVLNNSGDYALGLAVSGVGEAISVNGAPSFLLGDVLPATQPYALDFLRTLDMAIDDAGEVLWFGGWDHPSSFVDNGMFRSGTMLHQENGWTTAGGVTVDRAGVEALADISPNGRWVVFDAVLGNGNSAICRMDALGLPEAYCTAGTSASGCRAAITGVGLPSATAASGFDLRAAHVEGQKDGLFFYGVSGRQAVPWGSGSSYRCVVPPVRRGGLQAGTGTPGACDGAFALDLNARWCPACPNPAHNPGAGTTVQAQLWYRDPQGTSNQTTSFSDATEFTVGP